MPALSKKQQKFMGIVRSIQKGEQPASKFSKDAQDVAKDMKKKDVKKFAATKHKGLPVKKEVLNKLKEMIRQELSEYTYGTGDVVKDVNPSCPHYGAMGKVKSVNPRSVVFVVMNKGKNFKPGMELEKSHDQMKKMNESINEINDKFVKYMNDFYGPKGMYVRTKKPLTLQDINKAYSILLKKRPKYQWANGDAFDRENLRDELIKLRILSKDLMNKKESVNEMSAKSKKIINKLNKKEKEMFMDMVDMMGFDQVMADYKRDKKAFKQALKDMSESVITEKFTVKSSREYFNNLDQALSLIINQANNLKGPLAKHPIKQNLNKLKAVKTMLKRGLAPAFYAYEKERHVEESFKGVDITELKKKLQNGKFKSAVEFSLLPAIDTRSYDSNSFYFLKDKKENKLRKRLVDVLYDLRNKMDNAQLESFEEGFGGELNEKDKKKFEKERVENAEVLGYELTGVKDVNESMSPSQLKKMRDDFEKTGELPPHLKKFVKDVKILKKKHKVKNIVVPGLEWMSDMKESVNEASVSQVRSTISRVKKQLMKKWAKKGGYENFGQKELRNLKSKFKENPYGSPEERQISQMLSSFDNWAMNYSGDMRESVNEDGHTDVASSKRKVMIMVDDSNKLLNKLNGMNKEDSLPSWWTDKITLSQNYLAKATNYLLNPVESITESKEPDVITQLRDIVKRKSSKKIKDPKTKKTMRVDMYTASVVTQVYDAVKKTSHKSKFESLPLDKMAQLSFKMIK